MGQSPFSTMTLGQLALFTSARSWHYALVKAQIFRGSMHGLKSHLEQVPQLSLKLSFHTCKMVDVMNPVSILWNRLKIWLQSPWPAVGSLQILFPFPVQGSQPGPCGHPLSMCSSWRPQKISWQYTSLLASSTVPQKRNPTSLPWNFQSILK